MLAAGISDSEGACASAKTVKRKMAAAGRGQCRWRTTATVYRARVRGEMAGVLGDGGNLCKAAALVSPQKLQLTDFANSLTIVQQSNEAMKVDNERTDRDAVIKLSGRLDINTSPDLRKAALTLCSRRRCRNLKIDFARVSFIDTSGLATLLEILVAAKDQCTQVTLSGLGENIRYLLEVNGLTGFFRIESSEQERLHA